MQFELTPAQVELRDELRAYLSTLMTPELKAELAVEMTSEGGDRYKEVVRQLGADGWLGIGWPKEFGGRGLGAIEQHVFFEEATRANAPVPLLALNTIGPALMRYGSDEQKEQFLPAILRGEMHMCIGYTEPESGTDLASLKTRAVRDGDEYVINGQKLFTTQAQMANYVWLAARTDPDVPKHKGITIFLVDLSLPGVKVSPIDTMMVRTNATFYDDVRVPVTARVGDEGEGWKLLTTQLNFERSSIVSTGTGYETLGQVTHWAADHRLSDGSRLLDQQWVQVNLARVRAKLDALRILNFRVAWMVENDLFAAADASAVKVFGTEFYIDAYRLLLDIVGETGVLREGSPGAAMQGRLERACRNALLTTFGGGVNEVQREIVATAGLHMPRAPR
ncbi:MAG: acyl-CoA dehydrogenase [Acidimicrobiia bacterium]|nr:acyl-CoA dehydrogenase [Acidimicrobiia bacterium]